MTAFLFPGQGSQFVGMGKDLYENFTECKEIFQKADDILGFKLSEICFNGPEEKLKQTDITQPALFVHSIAVLQLLKNVDTKASAGHSLGEYTALTFAGAFNFETALKIVRIRGQLMLESGIRNPGTMAAIVGLSIEKLKELCEIVSQKEIVQPANYNSPGQIVVSGSVNGVRELITLAKKNGAKLAKELVVSGAFHSPLMIYAYENIEKELNEIEIKNPKINVYSNVTSKKFTDASEIKTLLVQQIIKPVLWEQLVNNMINDGVTKFIEVGAGKVLTGLVKRINPKVETFSIGNVSEIKEYLEIGKNN